MDEKGRSKGNGIGRIVRFKGILRKWHNNVTKGSKAKNDENHNNNNIYPSSNGAPHGAIPPATCKRLRGYNVCANCDEEKCQSPKPPRDVPKGYLAVYVGPELRRFIIPTSYLSDPLFKVLLEKVEEEFGFNHSGGLTIPCEIETSKYLLTCMENHLKEQGEHESFAAERSQTSEE